MSPLRSLLVLTAALLLAVSLANGQTPRPEYPQPQWERGDWLSLNGSWQFRFDQEDLGLRQRWFATEQSWPQSIVVPYAWETKLSGVGVTEFRERAWYQREFTIPANWPEKRTLLHFGVDLNDAQVWGEHLAGSHEGGNVPFRFDITTLLTAGRNRIAVRVEDPPADRAIPRGKQYWEPKSRGIFYTRTSGIWQSVWLENAGDSHLLRRFRFRPFGTLSSICASPGPPPPTSKRRWNSSGRAPPWPYPARLSKTARPWWRSPSRIPGSGLSPPPTSTTSGSPSSAEISRSTR
ncbi:MAG: hypothetical protein U5J83_12235 [Bryobacterales bacterium]|nr:hypothetical protein [Bryobacterales bacterium]